MAEVAPLADVDIAAGELEGRVRPDAVHLLDRVLEVEQRGHFHDAADRNDDQREYQQERGAAFDDAVLVEQIQGYSSYSAGCRRVAVTIGRSVRTRPAMVIQMLKAITRTPLR